MPKSSFASAKGNPLSDRGLESIFEMINWSFFSH